MHGFKAGFECDLIVQSLLVSEMRGVSAGYLCNVILGKLSAGQRRWDSDVSGLVSALRGFRDGVL